jgi:arylformamidase
MPYSAASPYAPPAGLTGGWIDISTPLDPETTPVYPDNFGLVFSFTSELANGQGVNLSKYCVGAHSGTHVDAPLHFLEGGFAIDRLDVGRLIGKAHVLEIPSNVHAITSDVLEKQRWRGHERLLFKTMNSAQDWLMQPSFQQEYCYLAPDAAELLATEPLAMVGIDYLSVEGFQHEPRTHRALLGNSIAVVEGLRLGGIPAGDYEIVVLPLKIVGHEGAPARALLRKLS